MDFVDASEWQAVFDPATYARAGFRMVSLRLSDGGYVDRTFGPRWPAARGLTRWAYHFARPGDGAADAARFLANVNAAGGFMAGDVAMLDVEPIGMTPQQAGPYAQAFLGRLRQLAPALRLTIYGNAWYIEAAGLTEASLPNVGLVVASYGAGYPMPAGWSHACAWQYTDSASVPGFSGGVDCNRLTCPTGLAHLDSHTTPHATGVDDVITTLPTIAPGDPAHGDFVRIAVSALQIHGWPMPSVVSAKDPRWLAGIQVVQRWADLAVDGVLGPQTWQAVLKTGPYAKRAVPA